MRARSRWGLAAAVGLAAAAVLVPLRMANAAAEPVAI